MSGSQAEPARTASIVADAVILSLGSVASFLLVANALPHVYFISTSDSVLGAMWAVIATIFVNRTSYHDSVTAVVSRLAATIISFVICLVYLIFLPFHVWALGLLIGVSVLVAALLRRPQDAVTAAITTTVILVVADVTPKDAWSQPILRLADTVIGVAVGLVTAWIYQRLVRPRLDRLPSKRVGPGNHTGMAEPSKATAPLDRG
jgi:uncharacterized membrane protein YccC